MRAREIGIAIMIVVAGVPLAMAMVRPGEATLVEVSAAARREIATAILASGSVAYEELVQLTPEVIGKVSEILVREGDSVARGQVLLRIDPAGYRAEVEHQEALRRQSLINIERQELNVLNQEREAERFERLLASGMIERSRTDNARYQRDLARIELRASAESLRTAQAQLAVSRERLARTEIRSPLAGKVVIVSIKAGETAVASSANIAGSSLLTIANDERLIVEVAVDEADMARVSPGQSATIVPAAYPERALAATIQTVAMAPRSGAQGQGKSYLAKLRIDDRQGLALRSGMSCRVQILASREGTVLSIPLQAVWSARNPKQGASETASVLVSNESRAEPRLIELGRSDDNHVEVRKGLEEGELVIVGRALRALRSGDRIAHRKPGRAAQ